MPEVISWHDAPPAKAIEHAVAHLAAGRIVAVPTETGYELVASTSFAEAVVQLEKLTATHARGALVIGLPGAQFLRESTTGLCTKVQRMAHRAWPGRLALRAGEEIDFSQARSWAEQVRQRLMPGGRITFRCPDHDAALLLLRTATAPLAFAAVPHQSAVAVREAFRGGVALIIQDDVAASEHPTLVDVDKDRWRIVSEGALSEADVQALTPCRIVFVCTGNTCRSPLAEALCTRLLAEHIGCEPAELGQHGYAIFSAGLAAYPGDAASTEAVAVASEFGADLSAHRSQPLTLEMLLFADYLFAMTQGHLNILLGYNTGVGPQPRLLSPHGEDVLDPIGRPTEAYRECAQQILRHLHERLPELRSAC